MESSSQQAPSQQETARLHARPSAIVTVALAAVGGFALAHSVILLLTTSAPTSRTHIIVTLEMVGAVVGLGGRFPFRQAVQAH
jgi:hypothetical protein